MRPDALAALLPVVEGEEDAVRALLQELPGGEASPFARLESTHFARLVLLPGLRDRHDHELDGVPACLFLAAELDIPAAGWLEALGTLMPDEADALFGRCAGYPGAGVPPAFGAWVLRHRVPAGFSLHGNPRARADEIAAALALRERIIAFAVETRALGPAALRRRWDEEWGAPA